MDRSAQSEAFLQIPQIHTEWESDYLNQDMDAHYDGAIRLIAQKLGLPAGTRLLDAGCGYAYHAVRLARQGFDVTGIDFSEAALAHARERIAESGLDHIRVQRGDRLNVAFEDGSFPVVLSWGVLMHIPNLERALQELARVLAPGGYLVLSENDCRSFDVHVVEALIRSVKGLLGRRLNPRTWTERGVEEWFPSSMDDPDSPGLLVRKTDFAFIDRVLREKGLQKAGEFSEQYTELFTRLPAQWMKQLVYKLNHKILLSERNVPGALGKILIYRKQ